MHQILVIPQSAGVSSVTAIPCVARSFFFFQTSADNDYCTFSSVIWYALLNENSRDEKSGLRDSDRFGVVYCPLIESFFRFSLFTPYTGSEIAFAVLRNPKHTVLLGFCATYSKRKTVNFRQLSPAALNDLRLTLAYSKYAICARISLFA